jgi:serine/threonine-protein kinase
VIRVGKLLGKYRIVKRLAEGGFARVYRAYDTVAGVPVAIKVPDAALLTKEALDDFRREVRISAKLDHPNILPVKDAGGIDGIFVVIYPLGDESLADRMTRRMSVETVVSLSEQMLEGVAFAHRHRVMHCDIKPENFILFSGNRVRLADFGIAKVAVRTLAASGSGTVGYIAPEQAMGKPSLRSDVFSLGLILYRMLSGSLPEWPFEWPPPGYDRVRKSIHRDVISFLQRAMQVDSSKRYADASRMLAAFKRVKPKALRSRVLKRTRRNGRGSNSADWRTIRQRQFQRRFRRQLEARHECSRCKAPVAETMQCCPWCGSKILKWSTDSRFQKRCPRCKRGVKSDWRFCPWCYGGRISDSTAMRYDDNRYERRCKNRTCIGKWLMPFMRYCPWCRRKVERPWSFEGGTAKCPRCRWTVLPDFWDKCPWCARNLRRS